MCRKGRLDMLVFSHKASAFLQAFAQDQRGATAIEYALIASGIFLAIVLAVNTYGSNMNIMYSNVQTQVDANID